MTLTLSSLAGSSVTTKLIVESSSSLAVASLTDSWLAAVVSSVVSSDVAVQGVGWYDSCCCGSIWPFGFGTDRLGRCSLPQLKQLNPPRTVMVKQLMLPFPPLKVLDRDGLITWDWLEPLIQPRLDKGVSLCITAHVGATKRGGYFFHVKRTAAGFEFDSFDRPRVLTLATGAECAAFMNHVSGRLYDAGMWGLCQLVNLKADAER